jgi:tetratricopeptide (TPR) repeat protein
LPLIGGDTVASWNFPGAYTGHADLEEKARAEIVRLENLLGKKEYTDYILFVSIANQYDLLGDGAKELEYLRYALALDATTTGLAWHNTGQLFARLGALRSARHALEQAVLAQPIMQYHQALLDLLLHSFPDDTKSITEERRALGQIPGELAQ